jgi:hypothetical protein
VIGHEGLVFEGVVGTNSHDGLEGAHCFKPLGLALGFPPIHLLFHNVEEGHDITQAAMFVAELALPPSFRAGVAFPHTAVFITGMSHLWRGTFPYVTDIITTSTSSGVAASASSSARISSTPVWRQKKVR